jgi:hypothetical protein
LASTRATTSLLPPTHHSFSSTAPLKLQARRSIYAIHLPAQPAFRLHSRWLIGTRQLPSSHQCSEPSHLHPDSTSATTRASLRGHQIKSQ